MQKECPALRGLYVYSFWQYEWGYTVVSRKLSHAVEALMRDQGYEKKPTCSRDTLRRFVLSFDTGIPPDDDEWVYDDMYAVTRRPFKLDTVY